MLNGLGLYSRKMHFLLLEQAIFAGLYHSEKILFFKLHTVMSNIKNIRNNTVNTIARMHVQCPPSGSLNFFNQSHDIFLFISELNKICRRFKIGNLNRDDISMYPVNQQDKLKTAITCVGNAEKTLEDFEEFLKNDKYKEWNDQQEVRRQEEIKNMIGEIPDGIPHKRPNNGEDDDEEETEYVEEDPEAANAVLEHDANEPSAAVEAAQTA